MRMCSSSSVAIPGAEVMDRVQIMQGLEGPNKACRFYSRYAVGPCKVLLVCLIFNVYLL